MSGGAAELLRRSPIQQRAQDRIERILAAADQTLSSEGTLDTRVVAAVAGVSIGSLYHWFPDKTSIAQTLAQRYWAELSELVEQLAEQPSDPVADARSESAQTVAEPAAPGLLAAEPAATVLTVLADGMRARPGFLALWFGELRTEQMRDLTRPSRQRVGAAVTRLLADRYPQAEAELVAAVSRVLVLLGDGLLREAFRTDRRGDRSLLGEGALALTAYAQARLEASV